MIVSTAPKTSLQMNNTARVLEKYVGSDGNILLEYNGPFVPPLILELGKHIRQNASGEPSINEVLFYVFIELAENIKSYSAHHCMLNDRQIGIGRTMLLETDSHFTLMAGNLVEVANSANLKQRCELITGKDRQNLRQIKSSLRTEGDEKGHTTGNIGLVNVAIRADSNIDIHWHDFNEQDAYFMISVTIAKQQAIAVN